MGYRKVGQVDHYVKEGGGGCGGAIAIFIIIVIIVNQCG